MNIKIVCTVSSYFSIVLRYKVQVSKN